MEGSITTIVIVIVVLWYLGSTINTVLAKSGKMAEREYSSFEREQAFRVTKAKDELKAKYALYAKENHSDMSDEDLDKALGLL